VNNKNYTLTAADRSNCPTTGRAAGVVGFGLDAVGIGGCPTFFGGGGGAGLTATEGFGLVAIGGPGGLISSELEGREVGAEALEATGAFFHGVADPFEGPMPGKTATGLLDTSADTELVTFGGIGAAGRLGGGGGAGAGAALGGKSSR
jgi:hypothetical protein